MRIGLIARADNTGLGMLSWEFYENLREYMEKILIVDPGSFKQFPERFNQSMDDVVHIGSLDEIKVEKFLEGLDIVLTIETPYSWSAFSMAKQMGVKSVLIPMFEGNSKPLDYYPDLIACPCDIDYQSFDNDRINGFIENDEKWYPKFDMEIINLPVNRKRLPFKKRERAITFVHNVGHAGLHGRTGTKDLIEAFKLVENPNIKLIIHSQVNIVEKIDDPRIQLRIGNVKNYWDLWQEGDVFILPVKFEMISMPVQEALSVGMPVLTTNFKPFSDWLPPHWLIDNYEDRMVKLHQRDIKYADHDVERIAKKIEEWAEKPIEQNSLIADQLAQEISWEAMKPKWENLLNNLVSGKRE